LVSRTTYSYRYFEVDGIHDRDAEETAISQAGNHAWDIGNVEYDVEDVQEIG
jgi:hypothetical protein